MATKSEEGKALVAANTDFFAASLNLRTFMKNQRYFAHIRRGTKRNVYREGKKISIKV